MTEYKPTQLMLDWEKALRNPEMKQVEGALCQIDSDGNKSYCCLGVLAEIAGNTPKPIDWSTHMAFYGPTAWGETGLPDHRLIDMVLGTGKNEELDFPYEGNITLGRDEFGAEINAAELNDDYYWTFTEIADQVRMVYIEGTGDPKDYIIESDRLDIHRSERDCE